VIEVVEELESRRRGAGLGVWALANCHGSLPLVSDSHSGFLVACASTEATTRLV
jgi:hypothetical protein